ncbi:fibulin-1-like [Bombyx mandarina]|uniref:Fibulin-1-like n=1 Tax=Bombyx mandarina TaxID=7092 RepID=A0A6J2KKE6_BOMMA|nr:fibulin-1-like [Bombyx mandarina]
MLKTFLFVACIANVLLADSTEETCEQDSDDYRNENDCGLNEEFSDCPDGACRPLTCDEVGYPVPCADIDPERGCPSEPKCICKNGFVLNNSSICIPIRECPSCGGDPNAEGGGCGLNCGNLCSNYDQKPIKCSTDICEANGCDCRQGYVFDEIKRICVLPNECRKNKKQK